MKTNDDPSEHAADLRRKAEDIALENAARLKEFHLQTTLLDNIPGCFAMILKKGTREIVASNRTARESGAIPGKTCFNACAMRDDNCPFCLAPQLWTTGQPQRIEVEYRGTWYEGIWVPLSEDLYVHYIFNITERRRGEEDMNHAQALAHVGSWCWEPQNDVVSWSEEMYRIFGVTPETFDHTTKGLAKLIHPEDLKLQIEGIEVFLQGKPFMPYEYRVIRPNGDIRFVHVFDAKVETNASGQTIRVFGALQDITERKQAEAKLRASEARHRAMFEHAIEGIFQSSVEGKARAANPVFVQMLGYASEKEVLNTLIDLPRGLWANPEERAIVKRLIEEQGYVRGYECEFLRKDGKKIWISLNATAVREHDGQAGYFHGSIEDITERRQAELEKAKLEAQLQQAQKMESVGRLAGGVAHDFNNMLGVILGHAEMALEQTAPEHPIYDDLTEIRKAAGRSADLTRQLLAFARKQTVLPKVLDLNETIAGMLEMLKRMISENIRLSWQPAADLWLVKVDPSQIDQILANLCVNSRDAIADVGKITIKTGNRTFDEHYCATHIGSEAGEYVWFSVGDDGCGMDKDTQGQIFEPFFTTKSLGSGTGLGLATVFGAVKQNRGFIDVHSEPERGTTFTIYLPRYVGKTEQALKEHSARPANHGCETIILVEDDPAILKLTTTMLERLGYSALTANSPGKAIRLAQEHASEIHLLITDVVMPEMNGKDLAEMLRVVHPHLKSLFMSGYTADVIAHHGVLDSGIHFIQKPFSAQNLAAKIREVLESNS